MPFFIGKIFHAHVLPEGTASVALRGGFLCRIKGFGIVKNDVVVVGITPSPFPKTSILQSYTRLYRTEFCQFEPKSALRGIEKEGHS